MKTLKFLVALILLNTNFIFAQNFNALLNGKTWYFPVKECSQKPAIQNQNYFLVLSFTDDNNCVLNGKPRQYKLVQSILKFFEGSNVIATYKVEDCNARFLTLKQTFLDESCYLYGISISNKPTIY